MYITPAMLDTIIARFGVPKNMCMTAPVSDREFDFIRSTQKDNRAHDVTFYIFKDREIIVNAKHTYPPGLFRAPSGGLCPGEDFESGIKREAREETGVEIEVRKFLLIIKVTFATAHRSLDWTSYIFRGEYLSGELAVFDKREIREVRLADMAEFDNYKKIIEKLNWGGLSYRARLHDAVKELL